MKLAPLATTLLLLLCFSSHAQTAQTASPDDGEVRDGVYFSTFFNLSFEYPKDWVVHEEAINQRIRDRAKEQAAKTGTLAQQKNTYLLFTVSRYARGEQPSGYNPTILLIAERIDHWPGGPNAKEYLLSVRAQKVKRGVQALLKDPVAVPVNGMQFFRDDYSETANGVSMKQSVFVTTKKGFALAFSFSGEDEKGLAEIVKAMYSILPTGRGGSVSEPKPD